MKNGLKVRDINEKNRTATPLELFYDLIFVVAIAHVAVAFHHDFAHNHIGHGVVSFIMVFMAIWWAWNQYTWFASSFNNSGVRFKLATLWQMVGALVIAAGVNNAFNGDFTVVIIGYVIIRSSGILLWLRVASDNPKLKITGRRYAMGTLLCQVGWITQNLFEFSYFIFVVLWLAEFIVPYYAESHTQTHFHSKHIEERFGLLTCQEMAEKYPEEWKAYNSISKFDYVIPQGESQRERYERSVSVFNRLADMHPDEQIVLVSHGGILRGNFEYVLDLPPGNEDHFKRRNATYPDTVGIL